MRRCWPVFVAGFALAATTQVHAANDIDLGGLAGEQRTFDRLVDQLATAVAYNAVAPAETLGVTGFDLGIAVSAYDIDGGVWDEAVRDGNASSYLPVPRLFARKGLPLGFDVGASYTRVPDSNIRVWGAEVRKALIEGGTATPAVSVMGHYSSLDGVDDLDLSSWGIDLGISKGFAMLTPYAGIGRLWYDGSERAGLGLRDRDDAHMRSYLGVRVGLLPFMSVTAQADFSEVDSYSLRLNLGF